MFKIALCQTKVEDSREINIRNACEKISDAADKGAKIVALGEMFNCPYSGRYFSAFSEKEESSTTLEMLKEICREKSIYLVGGSIPEEYEGRIYNTSYIINPDGCIIGKHRKIHLFDVDIENGIRFMESDYLAPGKEVTIFNTSYGTAGVCICYDIRFPELIRTMVLMGAKMIFVPAAFNMTTGPAHWETLFRARAVDNQVYMIGISPARDYDGVYTAYGHSIVVNPWGKVIAEASEKEEIVFADIDMDFEDKVRNELPLIKHRRPELYRLK